MNAGKQSVYVMPGIWDSILSMPIMTMTVGWQRCADWRMNPSAERVACVVLHLGCAVRLNEAGRAAAIEVPGVDFWEQNWRKGGLQERRRELIAEYCFYNQTYCGCEYSLRATEAYAVSKTAGK